MKDEINIIGISGGTGSGKSFISSKIKDEFGTQNIEIIELDSYYKDLSHLDFFEREKINFDHPEIFDFDLLINNLEELKNNNKVSIPIYCYKTHTRKRKKKIIFKKKIVIVEGIYSIYNDNIRDKMIYKVFIDIPEDIRLKRRIKRDIDLRARTEKSVKIQYKESVKVMHKKFVAPLKTYANLIINNNKESYNILTKRIYEILFKNG